MNGAGKVQAGEKVQKGNSEILMMLALVRR